MLEETAKTLKRHKQRFLGDLHVDQQKLRAQLEVLRSDVETFAELGDITQVCTAACRGHTIVRLQLAAALASCMKSHIAGLLLTACKVRSWQCFISMTVT